MRPIFLFSRAVMKDAGLRYKKGQFWLPQKRLNMFGSSIKVFIFLFPVNYPNREP